MLFTATGFSFSSQSTHPAAKPSIAPQLPLGMWWLPLLSGFVTMNHCSGGNRCPAETCRVNPVAADDTKVPAEARVRYEGRTVEKFSCASHRRSNVAQRREATKAAVLKKKSASGYNPLSSERVRQIIAALDQLYPM